MDSIDFCEIGRLMLEDPDRGFTELNRHFGTLVAFASYFLRNDFQASEDVVQEVLRALHVGISLKSIRIRPEHFRALVSQMIRYKAFTRAQKDRHRRAQGGEEGNAQFAEIAFRQEERSGSYQEDLTDRLNRCIERLPVLWQVILEFRSTSGITLRELADLLGLTEARVRTIYYRALERIHQCMEGFAGL